MSRFPAPNSMFDELRPAQHLKGLSPRFGHAVRRNGQPEHCYSFNAIWSSLLSVGRASDYAVDHVVVGKAVDEEIGHAINVNQIAHKYTPLCPPEHWNTSKAAAAKNFSTGAANCLRAATSLSPCDVNRTQARSYAGVCA